MIADSYSDSTYCFKLNHYPQHLQLVPFPELRSLFWNSWGYFLEDSVVELFGPIGALITIHCKNSQKLQRGQTDWTEQNGTELQSKTQDVGRTWKPHYRSSMYWTIVVPCSVLFHSVFVRISPHQTIAWADGHFLFSSIPTESIACHFHPHSGLHDSSPT